MSKSKRITLLITNIVMLIAGLYGLIGFGVLTHVHSAYGFSGYPSRDLLLNATNIDSLRSAGIVAAWNWERYTFVIDDYRWIVLTIGSIIVVGCIIHLWLTPVRKKGGHDA